MQTDLEIKIHDIVAKHVEYLNAVARHFDSGLRYLDILLSQDDKHTEESKEILSKLLKTKHDFISRCASFIGELAQHYDQIDAQNKKEAS